MIQQTTQRSKHSLRFCLVCLLTLLLTFPLGVVNAQRRGGSFGGGSFGGSRSFGGGSFGGSRSSGGSFGGGSFGGSRSSGGGSFGGSSRSFGGGSFGTSGTRSSGSFGSGSTSRSTGSGGSFGQSGSFGTQSYTHSSSGYGVGSTYGYRGSYYPTRSYGGWSDYSFYWGHPSWYYYTPFAPAFYYNPPVYVNGYMEPGGFNFLHFLLSMVFFVFLLWLVGKILFGRKSVRYTTY